MSKREWASDFGGFKAELSPVPAGMELVRRRPAETWGPNNFE
jgi:hypothetical protein